MDNPFGMTAEEYSTIAVSDYLAKILGLKPYPETPLVIMTARSSNSAAVVTPIFQDFSAKYLPQLVEKWKHLDKSHATLYSDVLRALTRNNYWGRFQLTHPLGRIVAAEHALRLSRQQVPIKDDAYNFSGSTMFLWNLLIWEDKQGDEFPIPEATAEKIVELIEEFLRDCPGQMGTTTAKGCMLLLRSRGSDPQPRFTLEVTKAQWTMDLRVCGFCDAEEGPGGAPLMRCGKCRNVAYCGAEHQKMGWRGHKARCIKASWE
ncbi:hypothetical protein BDP27DRAFT_1478335 [Rhodocollybia butyracea]|uniref:MYND-type domain-containing protein n=1 Tax=Rhodocollybia butyracea TaxID=206335 RepID=A0A9P5PHM3_9AGAR|nr:hypothetical protein BDP27DRAFT_1478335 [Rhodocollybia butyracea]